MMFAEVWEVTNDRGDAEQRAACVRELRFCHAARPGFRGGMALEAGDDRVLAVLLYDTREHAEAARATVSAPMGRGGTALLVASPSLVAAGPLLYGDLAGIESHPHHP